MNIQELSLQEIEQVDGAGFSPGRAAFGIGIVSAAAGGLIFGPVGAAGAAGAYAIGYGGTRLVQFIISYP
jgi:hypothetical protein